MVDSSNDQNEPNIKHAEIHVAYLAKMALDMIMHNQAHDLEPKVEVTPSYIAARVESIRQQFNLTTHGGA